MERCGLLANISEEPDLIVRPCGSDSMREVNEIISGWMREAGMSVRQDATKDLIATTMTGDGTRALE